MDLGASEPGARFDSTTRLHLESESGLHHRFGNPGIGAQQGRIYPKVGVGRERSHTDFKVGLARLQVDRLGADKDHRIAVPFESVKCVKQHPPGRNVERVGGCRLIHLT
jgi:hypothetical protein